MTSQAPDRLRSMVVSAAMAALALILPIAFHAVGLGSQFLPMLLPLLLNGFLVPLPWALLTGAAVPLISSLATGMPPMYPPVALQMSLEGAAIGGIASAIYGFRPKRLWPALLTAVLVSRLVGVGAMWLLARAFGLPAGFVSAAMLVKGLPGVALQIVVIPLAIGQLRRSRNILVARDDSQT